MKRKLSVILILLLLFLCACSNKDNNGISKETADASTTNLQQNQKVKLPAGFTKDKIENALLEYINYRLWLYPAKIMDAVSEKSFDNYIGKSIDIEIRIYKTDLGESVYAQTNIGNWLAVFKSENGFVYCDGQTSEGEYGWPNNIEDYAVFEKYSIVIPQPHKPNYGSSQRMDKMITALEADIRVSLEDFYNSADRYHDEWINVEVYIADFYEYEIGAHAWLCRRDGVIVEYPVAFEEVNNEIKVQKIKGFTMNNKNEFNEFGRLQFERDIGDAVRHFKWNLK
ncbi:MAG: hypothetical protein K0S04_535 [Herbinix sp.]|jgi:hypothetical protein|nr:hypothetical protein [Herbinix sp.]